MLALDLLIGGVVYAIVPHHSGSTTANSLPAFAIVAGFIATIVSIIELDG